MTQAIPVPRRPTLDNPGREYGPEDLGTRFRTSGGPSQINLAWEALLEANRRLSAAAEVSDQQWQRIAGIGASTVARSPVPLHWRMPLFGVRLVALTARVRAVHEMVRRCAEAVDFAHEQYREAEGAVQRLIQLAVHLAETSVMIEHLMDPDGDKDLVKDWAVSLAALAGGHAVDLTEIQLSRSAAGTAGVALLKAISDNAGIATFEMGHHALRLREQTGSSSHLGDGTYTSYLEEMADVGAEGDVAVTVVTGEDGQKTYLVHLPGLALDPEDINREDGRGYLGLVDAVDNDSEELAEVVEEALAAAGAEEGDAIALSGYSMGGIAAVNLAQSSSRLQRRYEVRAVATVGAPGQNKTIPPGTSAVHFQDGRDPVTTILGEAHQETAERLTVHYEHHNKDGESEGLFGGAHDFEHHQEVIEMLENSPEEHLSPEEQAMMDEFAELYDGEAETLIFETGWEERGQPAPEAPGEQSRAEDSPAQ